MIAVITPFVFLLSIIIMIPSCLIYLWSIKKLFNLLQHEDIKTWELLGSPDLFLNNSLVNNYLVLKWLLSRNYEKHALPIVKIARQCRRLFLLSGSCTILTMISFFFLG